MNRRIRIVGGVVTALFGLLVLQLTYLQVVSADRLAGDTRNVRRVVRDYSRARGPIVTAENDIVARSVAVPDEFGFQREYPLGPLFAHVAGYFSFTYGATGVEASYNDELAGRSQNLQLRNLSDLLIGKEHTGTVVLSLRRVLQETARDALAGRRGSVVALDPKTGAVLAMYSEPSFDPVPLAGHDQAAVRQAFESVTAQEGGPLLARAWRERYAPGSSFKIVTAATALASGIATPDRTFDKRRELDLPQTNRTLKNFGNSRCGGTLVDSFRVSCNTTFGQLGLELGEQFIDGMHEFGVGERIPLDVEPRPALSATPEPGSFKLDQPSFAQAGIGQGDVFVTPLQMALVVSAIANDGTIMKPHVASEIRDVDGAVVETVRPEVWRQAVPADIAATVRQMMIDVVAHGTGTRAQIPGVTVAGKTGTAQAPGGPPHTWFVGFAPAEDPKVAVAVVVERGGDLGNEATGGRVAAPIAKAVMEAALR